MYGGSSGVISMAFTGPIPTEPWAIAVPVYSFLNSSILYPFSDAPSTANYFPLFLSLRTILFSSPKLPVLFAFPITPSKSALVVTGLFDASADKKKSGCSP